IETGIDIPNVNTLIILDADHFGLSQLYQIRGRVGRSNKIAYCYLMYNKRKILSEIATKRLKVIKDFTKLGSGFAIAMRDLSLRGAGDILGKEQAGFIDSVGIELFLSMLNSEIDIRKGEKVINNIAETPLIEVSTNIEDSYVSDEEIKIDIHNKINLINNKDDLLTVKEELENRFGKLSEAIIIYMYEELFESEAKKIGINKIKQGKNSIEITLNKSILQKIKVQELFVSVNNISRMFRFAMKNNDLIITLDIIKLDKHFIYYLVDFIETLKKAYVLI
ncbi:MAG: helicase-related protein, partial [Bacilli bacterium]|nr:helicase-related protein [Bacilli bacterium]